jgi:hypothetical protein
MREGVISGDSSTPGLWSEDFGGYYDADVSFRTDSSLVYQMVCQPQAMLSIRGILDVTPNSGLDESLAYFTKWYGIENPQYGQTYSIDVKFIMATNGDNYITVLKDYHFDSSGNHISMRTNRG